MNELRGFFAIGVERIGKPTNLDALLRTAHAFGASYAFTIAAAFDKREVRLSDTADSARHLPIFSYHTVENLSLLRVCPQKYRVKAGAA